MDSFILGCNYWASHAGTDMWLNWDESQIDKDIALLKQNGIQFIRVFPNWRDFQPVEPILRGGAKVGEYMLTNYRDPENPWYLDNTMLDRFDRFCDLASKYDIKLIVGLLTGFMSGRTFIPPALINRNLFTDPIALQFEIKFIRGFVTRFAKRPEIYAWNPGNECNNLSSLVDTENPRYAAFTWLATITNTIRAYDNTRPIISGMHGLKVDEGAWLIQDQGECVDIMTTHPYPYFVKYCDIDPVDSIRSLMHATCETKFYSDVSKKPCLIEEIGTLGPTICTDEISGNFMRLNLFSNWAHGANGLLWWCAHDQNELDFPPYSWCMLERELGMLRNDMTPKPHLNELNKFNEWLKNTNIKVSKPLSDGVILLTKSQESWAIAFTAFILAKQAGLTLDFVAPNTDIPKSDVYFMPSVCGDKPIYFKYYEQLKKRVIEGATLYVSNDNAFFTQSSEFFGNDVIENEKKSISGQFKINNKTLNYSHNKHFVIKPKSSTVIATDCEGNPLITLNRYGKGKVYYVAFPLEKELSTMNRAFDGNMHEVYAMVAKDIIDKKSVHKNHPKVGLTENNGIITAINYSNKSVDPGFKFLNKSVDKIYYGNINNIGPCDACVFSLK